MLEFTIGAVIGFVITAVAIGIWFLSILKDMWK